MYHHKLAIFHIISTDWQKRSWLKISPSMMAWKALTLSFTSVNLNGTRKTNFFFLRWRAQSAMFRDSTAGSQRHRSLIFMVLTVKKLQEFLQFSFHCHFIASSVAIWVFPFRHIVALELHSFFCIFLYFEKKGVKVASSCFQPSYDKFTSSISSPPALIRFCIWQEYSLWLAFKRKSPILILIEAKKNVVLKQQNCHGLIHHP